MSFQVCPACNGRGHTEFSHCTVCNCFKIIDENTGKPPDYYTDSTTDSSGIQTIDKRLIKEEKS